MEKQSKFDFSNAKEKKATTFWNFRENPIVEGVLKEIVVNEENNLNSFVLELEDGEKATVGSYTTLQNKLSLSDIGRPVKIEFVDETKSKIKGNKPYMNFKVLVI